MDCTATRLPYRQTGYFSKTVLDYIDQAPAIKPFFSHPPSLAGIAQAIEARRHFKTDRETLVRELRKQYAGVNTSPKVLENIESLLADTTFTITTAHQNNLFTGPLYFIYKILHAIKLSEHLRQSLPAFRFVPVFYIGSEDADLAELNHIYLEGNKLIWDTKQKGAVGRMKIDKELTKILHAIEGQLGVQPFGKDIVGMMKEAYKEGTDLQTATFHFVNALLGEYGIVVLLPDNASLKKEMIKIFEDDLLHQKASAAVERTVEALHKASYKVQANPREINLYGGFAFLSIYAYTELMDRNRYALAWEMVRVVLGLWIIYTQGDWFGASTLFPNAHYFIAGYFIIALMVTAWFVVKHYREDHQVLPLPA